MMKFTAETVTFCGKSCATNFLHKDSSGVALRFDKPYLPQEGRKVETVKTRLGDIHLKMKVVLSSYSTPLPEESDSPRVGPFPDIEHYYYSEIINNFNDVSSLGMCLFINLAQYYEELMLKAVSESNIKYYKQLADSYTRQKEQLEKLFDGILVYKSEPFYNSAHLERKYPSCILYIYDKELKNAI
jgi:hypothetical protein